jgi:hypothetical protein
MEIRIGRWKTLSPPHSGWRLEAGGWRLEERKFEIETRQTKIVS